MAKEYLTREGEVTAIDTETELTTLGDDGTLSTIDVPAGMESLEAIIVAMSADLAGAGEATGLVRLRGAGLLVPGGVTVPVGSLGGDVTTGGRIASPAKLIPLDLPVKGGAPIQIFVEMVGTDVGQLGMAVTLVFSDEEESGEVIQIICVEGQITAVDTKTSLTTQGSITPSMTLDSEVEVLDTIIACVAADMASAGSAQFFVRLTGAALVGEQVIAIGAHGGQDPQAGADPDVGGLVFFKLEGLEIEVKGGRALRIEGEMAGADLGKANMAVAVLFA